MLLQARHSSAQPQDDSVVLLLPSNLNNAYGGEEAKPMSRFRRNVLAFSKLHRSFRPEYGRSWRYFSTPKRFAPVVAEYEHPSE